MDDIRLAWEGKQWLDATDYADEPGDLSPSAIRAAISRMN